MVFLRKPLGAGVCGNQLDTQSNLRSCEALHVARGCVLLPVSIGEMELLEICVMVRVAKWKHSCSESVIPTA